MELLNALLDLVDVTLTAVGWVTFWFTWMTPRGTRSPQPSTPDDLQRFLREATVRPADDPA